MLGKCVALRHLSKSSERDARRLYSAGTFNPYASLPDYEGRRVWMRHDDTSTSDELEMTTGWPKMI